jgi:hypothetical protein
MAAKLYDSFNVGWVFNIKLSGTTILLAAIVSINYYLTAMARKNLPPNPKITKVIPTIPRSSLV